MNWLRISILIGFFLISCMPMAPVFSQEDDGEGQLPLNGVVILFTEIREDVFVFLDLVDTNMEDENRDESDREACIWVRFDENTSYVNEQEEALDIRTITIGTRLSIVEYEDGDDFAIAFKAFMLPPPEEDSESTSDCSSDDANDDDNEDD